MPFGQVNLYRATTEELFDLGFKFMLQATKYMSTMQMDVFISYWIYFNSSKEIFFSHHVLR
jgi:hypothetical protein